VGEFEKVNDQESSVDCDYDWADEAGHIRIGLEWTRHLFPKMTKQEVINRHAMLKQYWTDWMKRHHNEGTHGWEKFLPRMEKAIAKLATKEGSGNEKPANITYGGTDVFDFEMNSSR